MAVDKSGMMEKHGDKKSTIPLRGGLAGSPLPFPAPKATSGACKSFTTISSTRPCRCDLPRHLPRRTLTPPPTSFPTNPRVSITDTRSSTPEYFEPSPAFDPRLRHPKGQGCESWTGTLDPNRTCCTFCHLPFVEPDIRSPVSPSSPFPSTQDADLDLRLQSPHGPGNSDSTLRGGGVRKMKEEHVREARETDDVIYARFVSAYEHIRWTNRTINNHHSDSYLHPHPSPFHPETNQSNPPTHTQTTIHETLTSHKSRISFFKSQIAHLESLLLSPSLSLSTRLHHHQHHHYLTHSNPYTNPISEIRTHIHGEIRKIKERMEFCNTELDLLREDIYDMYTVDAVSGGRRDGYGNEYVNLLQDLSPRLHTRTRTPDLQHLYRNRRESGFRFLDDDEGVEDTPSASMTSTTPSMTTTASTSTSTEDSSSSGSTSSQRSGYRKSNIWLGRHVDFGTVFPGHEFEVSWLRRRGGMDGVRYVNPRDSEYDEGRGSGNDRGDGRGAESCCSELDASESGLLSSLDMRLRFQKVRSERGEGRVKVVERGGETRGVVVGQDGRAGGGGREGHAPRIRYVDVEGEAGPSQRRERPVKREVEEYDGMIWTGRQVEDRDEGSSKKGKGVWIR